MQPRKPFNIPGANPQQLEATLARMAEAQKRVEPRLLVGRVGVDASVTIGRDMLFCLGVMQIAAGMSSKVDNPLLPSTHTLIANAAINLANEIMTALFVEDEQPAPTGEAAPRSPSSPTEQPAAAPTPANEAPE